MVPVLLLIGFPLLVGLMCRRYVLASYPSDEKLQCDRSTLTICKVRWLDLRNSDWETRSYALSDVSQVEYRAVASLRGTSIYGLRLVAHGRREWILPGLDRQNAKKILKALKALGADVVDA